jgi:hypothetical protein
VIWIITLDGCLSIKTAQQPFRVVAVKPTNMSGMGRWRVYSAFHSLKGSGVIALRFY